MKYIHFLSVIKTHIICKLQSFYCTNPLYFSPAQIVEDGSVSDFQDATVKVLFFLHEQLESEGDVVARAFRLETQIVETDEYDIHMVR